MTIYDMKAWVKYNRGLVLGGVVVFLLLWSALTSNSINNAAVSVDQAQADVQSQLQSRYDILTNSAKVVQSYADTNVELAKAYSTYLNQSNPDTNSIQGALKAQSELVTILGSQRMPTGVDPSVWRALQYDISGQTARLNILMQKYNQEVALHNRKVTNFPGSIVASVTGKKSISGFSASETAQGNLNIGL